MRKVGAIYWTMGKLMSTVLLIVFLVLVVWGISTDGLNPLLDRAGAMKDRVLRMFPGGNSSMNTGSVECMDPDIVNASAGLGEGNLTRCRNDCEIDLETVVNVLGKNSYKFKIDRRSGKYFYDVNGVYGSADNLIGDMDKADAYRNAYKGLNDIRKDIFTSSSDEDTYFGKSGDGVMYLYFRSGYEYQGAYTSLFKYDKSTSVWRYSWELIYDFKNANWGLMNEDYDFIFKKIKLKYSSVGDNYWTYLYGDDYAKWNKIPKSDEMNNGFFINSPRKTKSELAMDWWLKHKIKNMESSATLVDEKTKLFKSRKIDGHSLQIGKNSEGYRVVYFEAGGETYGLILDGDFRLTIGRDFKVVSPGAPYWYNNEKLFNSVKKVNLIHSYMEKEC